MSGSRTLPQEFGQQHTDPVRASCSPTRRGQRCTRGSDKVLTHPFPIWLGAIRGDGRIDLDRNPEKCQSRRRWETLETWSLARAASPMQGRKSQTMTRD